MLLGDATGLRVGASQVERVMYAGQEVWTGLPLRFQTGIASGYMYLTVGDETFGLLVDDLADLGVRWLRCDVPWDGVEASEGVYDWELVDRFHDAAEARGIRTIGVVSFTPAWARSGGTNRTPPTDPADYAAFCAQVALRYPKMVIEVWNEPNNSVFWTGPDAEDYAALLEAAYAAIKAVSPSTLVLLGGVCPVADPDPNPVAFLEGVYEAISGECFDAVAVHPYSFPAFPTDTGTNFMGIEQYVRPLMATNGDGHKLIWITEMGAPVYPDVISEQDQADMLADAYQQWFTYEWAGPLCWYTQLDSDTGSPGEGTFGIIRDTGVKKPAWSVLQALGG